MDMCRDNQVLDSHVRDASVLEVANLPLQPPTGAANVPSPIPYLSNLPPELVAYLLAFLPGNSAVLSTALLVCRQWYRLVVARHWHTLAPRACSQLRTIALNVAIQPRNSLLLNFDSNDGGGISNVLGLVREIDTTKLQLFDAEPSLPLNAILFHTRNLRVANFSNCLWITDTLITPLINCTHLVSLNLNGCSQITSNMLPAGAFPQLQSLSLAYCEAMKMLPETVNTLTTDRLAHVDLRASLLPDINVAVAMLLRKYAHSLESLNLEWAKFITDSAFRKAPELPHLRTLVLTRCDQLTDTTLAALCVPDLKELTLQGCFRFSPRAICQLVATTPKLCYLDISNLIDFQDDDMVALVTTFINLDSKASPPIQHLILNNLPALTDTSVYALKALPSLVSISLENNLRITMAALQQLLPSCPRLSVSIRGRSLLRPEQ
ncbi:hypothetical protein DFJ77DRAFT_473064 [Powellomyces hirtus]|nr:hypothetical protein DFJ77DRAFT_473064 [Powellomyces hirtus]